MPEKTDKMAGTVEEKKALALKETEEQALKEAIKLKVAGELAIKPEDVTSLSYSVLRGMDAIVKKNGQDVLYTTNLAGFEYMLKQFAEGVYKREIQEQFDAIGKKNYPYLKKAGLGAFIERKQRLDQLKKKIGKKTKEEVNCIEDLESKFQYLEKKSNENYTGEYYLNEFNQWNTYLNDWKSIDRVEYINAITGEVEDENIILENAKELLRVQNTYNTMIIPKYVGAKQRLESIFKLLPRPKKNSREYTEFELVEKLYSHQDFELEGINKAIECYEQTIKEFKKIMEFKKCNAELPYCLKLEKELIYKMEIYEKEVLPTLYGIRNLKELEFSLGNPLGSALTEIIESYELSKISTEKAEQALKALYDIKKAINFRGIFLTLDGELTSCVDYHGIKESVKRHIDPEIAKAIHQEYKSGTANSIFEIKPRKVGFCDAINQ